MKATTINTEAIANGLMLILTEVDDNIYDFDGGRRTLVIDTETGDWQLAHDNAMWRNDTDVDIDLDEVITYANENCFDFSRYAETLQDEIEKAIDRK